MLHRGKTFQNDYNFSINDSSFSVGNHYLCACMLFVLADNQELTRLGVTYLLSRIEDTETRTVDSKARLIALLQQVEANHQGADKERGCVVVLDFALFDIKDVDELLVIRQRFSDVRWVLLSEELTDEFISRVSAEGTAFSLVSKAAPSYEIDQALRCAIRGERFVCHIMMEQLISVPSRRQQAVVALTKTETEILREIAQGKTTKEIAADRCSSFHTVNTHRKNIFRKLHINTAYEATRYALKAGLIDETEYYI